MNNTPTLIWGKVVGVFYCTKHDGIWNEDDTECDFARDTGTETDCTRKQLYYQEPADA